MESSEAATSTDGDRIDLENSREKNLRRREKRLRKILENANSRIEKVGGRPPISSNLSHDLDYESVISLSKGDAENCDNGLDVDLKTDIFTAANPFTQENLDLISHNISTESATATDTNATYPKTSKATSLLVNNRLHIIFSSLFTCFISLTCLTDTDKCFSIFWIFGICVTMDLIFFREQKSPLIVLKFLMIMCGIPHSYIDVILFIWSTIKSIFADLSLFMFFLYVFLCIFGYIDHKYADLVVAK